MHKEICLFSWAHCDTDMLSVMFFFQGEVGGGGQGRGGEVEWGEVEGVR